MNELRDAACEYVLKYDWAIFPLMPLSKQPDGFLVPQGMKQASRMSGDILYWWERSPEANIGLNCRMSGILVLDFDPRNGGDDECFERLQKELGELPVTLTSFTPTGGWHSLFKHPGGEFRKQLADGVDIKDRGYIVIPPSSRGNMGDYTWDTLGALETPIAELPPEWIEAMKREAVTNEPRERSQHPLMQVPAEDYIEILSGRQKMIGPWFCCPFHREGKERTASLKVQDTMWSCFGCEPKWGKRVLGGNVLDFAGLLWGYPMPLAGADLQECKARVERELNAAYASA